MILNTRLSCTQGDLSFTITRAKEKRDTGNQFHVSMGAFDKAEVCKLVGLFILNQLEKNPDITGLGLYRDDGLPVMRSCSGSKADRIRKALIKIVHTCGLKITVQTNLKTVNFLDVTLNMNTSEYQPYRKPNNEPIYISQHSNHPPAIIKNIPPAIERTVSGLSSNQDTFKKAAPTYNHALRSAGYNYTIKYQNKENKNTKQNKKRRSRKITWYNPTYSKNVKTNFAADFLKLIDKQFPQTNKLHKIFNRSTVKIKLQLYEKHATDHQVTQLKGHERNEPTPPGKDMQLPRSRQLPTSRQLLG